MKFQGTLKCESEEKEGQETKKVAHYEIYKYTTLVKNRMQT